MTSDGLWKIIYEINKTVDPCVIDRTEDDLALLKIRDQVWEIGERLFPQSFVD